MPSESQQYLRRVPDRRMSNNREPALPVNTSHADYQKLFERLENKIRDQHAEFLKDQLHDAKSSRREARATLPDSRHEVSPFLTMAPLEKVVGISLPAVEVKNHICKNGSKSKRLVPITQAIGSFERMSRYKNHVLLPRSILVGDVRQLQYEPFLGDDIEDQLHNEIFKDFGMAKDPEASRIAEYASRLNEYLPKMLKEANLEKHQVTGAITDDASKFVMTFQKIFDIDLKEVLADESEDLSGPRDLSPRAVRANTSVKNFLETYVGLGCSVCGAHECGIHGAYETNDIDEALANGNKSMPLYDYDRFNMQFESMVARRDEKRARAGVIRPGVKEILEPCSPHCYLQAAKETDDSFEGGEEDFTEDDLVYIKTVLGAFPVDWVPYCRIAQFIGKPCRQVRARLVTMESPRTTSPQSKIAKETRRLAWYDTEKKKIDITLDWGLLTKTQLHHLRDQPHGCEHPGRSCSEAGRECSCVQAEILCEKYCGCPPDCFMKHTGCDCHVSCNHSTTCPCWLLNKECDPDLCHRFSNEKWHNCGNNNIQLGKEKRLILGESSHKGIGYGVYLLEPAEKGEYIIEYVGEVISHGEADRRGRIYDTVDASYLFDLNKDFNIDAFRYGNESRFINHDGNANCEAKVLLVNGEHRIGFWATRAIAAGQELFFNYGPKFVTKHGLMDSSGTLKGRGKARGGTRRGRGRKSDVKSARSVPVSPAKPLGREKTGRERVRGGGMSKRGGRGTASKFAAAPEVDEEVAGAMEGSEVQEEEADADVDVDVEVEVDEVDEEMMDYSMDDLPAEATSSSDEYEEYAEDDGEDGLKRPRRVRRPLKYTR